jgi:hypothetical protein
MGIFTNLLLGLVRVVVTGMDIVCFLILAHVLCYRLNYSWLNAIDSVGKPVVDWFTTYLQKVISLISRKYLSQRELLVIGILLLMFVRIFLVALIG